MILFNTPAAWTPDKDWLAVKPTPCPTCDEGWLDVTAKYPEPDVKHHSVRCHDCDDGVLPITEGDRVGLVHRQIVNAPVRKDHFYAVTHSAVVAEVLPTLPTDDFRTGRFVEHRDGYTWLYDGLHFVNITDRIVGDLAPGNLAVRFTDVATVEDCCIVPWRKHFGPDHVACKAPIPVTPPEGVDYWKAEL